MVMVVCDMKAVPGNFGLTLSPNSQVKTNPGELKKLRRCNVLAFKVGLPNFEKKGFKNLMIDL